MSKSLNASYKYNSDGVRHEKTVDGSTTKYYLEGTSIVYEVKGTRTIYYLYDATGVIGLKYDNNTYLFEKNLQGDIVGIVDSSNERAATYEYDAWGKILSIKDKDGNEVSRENHVGVINPFRYRGYYYDTETGLYYLNSRYYNPEWCRFINADGVIGANGDILSSNLYIYVSNNPINLDDRNGDFGGAGAIFGIEVAKETILGMIDVAVAVTTTVGPTLVDSAIQFVKSVPETVANVVENILPKPKEKEPERTFDSNDSTVIYRFGSSTNYNLTPRSVDKDGLSFTTIRPISGKYTMTTVEAVNKTMILKAVQSPGNPTHYSVVPVQRNTFVEWQLSKPMANEYPHFYTIVLKTILWDSNGKYCGFER